MSKFIFPLQNVLQIKYKLEDDAKNAYGIVKKKLNEEENKLAVLIERKDGYERKLREQVTSRLSVRDIISYENAVETMKYKMKMQQVIVKQHETIVEQARVKMQAAVTERKTYELLKEKAFNQFKIDLAKEEAKEIDELVSYKFNQISEDV